jgi:hypothetical protein
VVADGDEARIYFLSSCGLILGWDECYSHEEIAFASSRSFTIVGEDYSGFSCSICIDYGKYPRLAEDEEFDLLASKDTDSAMSSRSETLFKCLLI